MPDDFKGISVPAGAWERLFGKSRVTLGEVRDKIKSGEAKLGPEPQPVRVGDGDLPWSIEQDGISVRAVTAEDAVSMFWRVVVDRERRAAVRVARAGTEKST